MPLRIIRKKLGELLIERHIITSEQLELALEEQRRKGGYISQYLIALKFATELDIATCLSNQYNFAYLPLNNYDIPDDILKQVPFKWIKIYTILPIDRIGNILTVALADPLNEGVIQMLRQITNCEIQVFISTYSELEAAINKYFAEKLKDLKEAYIDAKDLAKIKTANEFIQTKVYKGPERREYVRINKELDITYYYHGKTFKGMTKDISYGGVAFISDIFISIDSSLVCKIYLRENQNPIDAVIDILRVQGIKKSATEDMQGPLGQGYEIGGCFDFVASDDRETLVAFLKENIP